MSKQRYPAGWDENRVRKLLKHYESQSDEEATAEIKAACATTTLEVPTQLVPTVRKLIAELKASQTKKSKRSTLQPEKAAQAKVTSRKTVRIPRG